MHLSLKIRILFSTYFLINMISFDIIKAIIQYICFCKAFFFLSIRITCELAQ